MTPRETQKNTRSTGGGSARSLGERAADSPVRKPIFVDNVLQPDPEGESHPLYRPIPKKRRFL